MHEKSDINKLLEGRCKGVGYEYVGFKKANESHSSGTATEIYDPISNRTVDTLSKGETYFFWKLRFNPHVVEIKEHVILFPDILAKIADKFSWKTPKRIHTTDFLVLYDTGDMVAYSVKHCRRIFDKSNQSESRWKMLIRNQTFEREHWEFLGVRFEIVFSDEINKIEAVNIMSCMKFYNMKYVSTVDHMYRYLISHRYVDVDLTKNYISSYHISDQLKKEIEELYQKIIKGEIQR